MNSDTEALKDWMKETLRMYRRFNRTWIKMHRTSKNPDVRASAAAHIHANSECIAALKAAIERL